MKVIDALLKAVRDAATFNPDTQVAPACILWPDRDHQWEAVIPVLQAELPELMVLVITPRRNVPARQSGFDTPLPGSRKILSYR